MSEIDKKIDEAFAKHFAGRMDIVNNTPLLIQEVFKTGYLAGAYEIKLLKNQIKYLEEKMDKYEK